MTFTDKIRDPLGKNSRLSRARAGDHQHRPSDMRDGLLLPFIGNDGNDFRGRLDHR